MNHGLVLVFPGQGSQYVGMGNWPSLQLENNFFNQADLALKFSLSTICQTGPADILKLTKNTQPAIFTHSVALYHWLTQFLASTSYKVEKVLGHSVGEYAALYAAGVLTFEDGVKAVNVRGKAMQAAVPNGKGKMYAVLKTDEASIIEACKEASTEDSQVMPANFNGPDQIVISGETKACERAIKYLEGKLGRVRAMELPVSAPFHSSLMKPAEEKMKEFFNTIKIQSNQLDYIANIDAENYAKGTSPKTIEENLLKQICGSVLWTQSVLKLSPHHKILEVGPGKVLSGLIKKINPELKVHSLEQGSEEESLTALKSFLEGV